MGTFTVKLGVADPQGRRYEEVEAMVDSGAAYTVLPASILEGLGVAPRDRRSFVLADGRRVKRDFGHTWLRLDGREDISPVVFWDEGSTPLLGAVTLEIFGLGVDPVNGRLLPVEAFTLAADSPAPASPATAGAAGCYSPRIDTPTKTRISRITNTTPIRLMHSPAMASPLCGAPRRRARLRPIDENVSARSQRMGAV